MELLTRKQRIAVFHALCETYPIVRILFWVPGERQTDLGLEELFTQQLSTLEKWIRDNNIDVEMNATDVLKEAGVSASDMQFLTKERDPGEISATPQMTIRQILLSQQELVRKARRRTSSLEGIETSAYIESLMTPEAEEPVN
jgi:hypothetical protein